MCTSVSDIVKVKDYTAGKGKERLALSDQGFCSTPTTAPASKSHILSESWTWVHRLLSHLLAMMKGQSIQGHGQDMAHLFQSPSVTAINHFDQNKLGKKGFILFHLIFPGHSSLLREVSRNLRQKPESRISCYSTQHDLWLENSAKEVQKEPQRMLLANWVTLCA